jgi:hypothetical protein
LQQKKRFLLFIFIHQRKLPARLRCLQYRLHLIPAAELQQYNEFGYNYFKTLIPLHLTVLFPQQLGRAIVNSLSFMTEIGAQFHLHGYHTCRGRVVPKAIVASETINSTIYTKPLPKYPSAIDKEKSDVEAAGPIMRVMDTRNWAIPFVAPKDARLGDAVETYI